MCVFDNYQRGFFIIVFSIIPFSVMNVNCLTFGPVSFTISKWNTCGDADNVFLKIPWSTSVGDCVLECAIRSRCKALNYKSRMRFCELLRVDGGTTTNAQCDYVKKSDIITSNIPCSSCSTDQVCDLSSASCVIRECTIPVIVNGTLMGNVVTPGGMIRIRCDAGFREMSGASCAICSDSGSWNQTLSCIPNGTQGSEAEEVHQNTAEESSGTCHAISELATDEWCVNNCNHVPPNCPSNMCNCD